VLARRLGVSAGVLLTALPFALIHEPEYKAWGPVLIIFLVGLVLTLVRAKMKSVGASFIVHCVYNGVPVVAAMVASHGFQHLEKLAQ
jgi:membrane protease YdiL (CAAX protease family)